MTPPPRPGGGPFGRWIGIPYLIAGLVVGGIIAGVAVNSRSPTRSGAATINVDSTPVKSGASDAVRVARQLGPAVGTIVARQPGGGSGLGSGFVISHNDGVSYLITNNHVVSSGSDLHALLPGGRNFAATLVGTDSIDDIAVVSVPDGSLPTAAFSPSSALKVGQPVVAIGSPLGNEGSVTQGIVSARHRTISAGGAGTVTTETLQDVLQTDASISPGNSGGPLADLEGRVVGVNVATAGGSSNIGFSIPSDIAVRVAQQLITHVPVQHPFLGIAYLTNTDAVQNGQGLDGPGVLVTRAAPGTPAAQAGFQTSDILMAVDGVPLDNGETLGGLIQAKHVGDRVTFSVRRGGETLSLTTVLTERPSTPGQ